MTGRPVLHENGYTEDLLGISQLLDLSDPNLLLHFYKGVLRHNYYILQTQGLDEFSGYDGLTKPPLIGVQYSVAVVGGVYTIHVTRKFPNTVTRYQPESPPRKLTLFNLPLEEGLIAQQINIDSAGEVTRVLAPRGISIDFEVTPDLVIESLIELNQHPIPSDYLDPIPTDRNIHGVTWGPDNRDLEMV